MNPSIDDECDANKVTKKVPAITTTNEKIYVQKNYDEALKRMLDNPSEENIIAFGEANRQYFAVMDAYRIASRLLFEKSIRKAEQTVGLPPMKRIISFLRLP